MIHLQKYKVHTGHCCQHISLKDWYTGSSPSWHHRMLVADVWWCHSLPVHRVDTFFDDLFWVHVQHTNSQSTADWVCRRTLILDRTMSADMRSLKHFHVSFHLSERSCQQDLRWHLQTRSERAGPTKGKEPEDYFSLDFLALVSSKLNNFSVSTLLSINWSLLQRTCWICHKGLSRHHNHVDDISGVTTGDNPLRYLSHHK